MTPRAFVLGAVAVVSLASLGGCKSKAQKAAEAAALDIAKLEKVVADRHLDSLPRALPPAANALAAKIPAGADLHNEATALGTAFNDLRNKSDDLRSAKHSYYAIADAAGTVVWVDDTNWAVVDRKVGVFPTVKDALDGKAGFTRGSGRFGGASELALSFMDASPLKDGSGKVVGVLLAAWEARDAAEDLQRQLMTDLAMKVAEPKTRVKTKDRLKMAMDTPELWVALFKGSQVYLQEDAPQPVEDAARALDLGKKTAGGLWVGTFDVMNTSWGGAAKRIDALGPECGVAVLRHEP